MPRAVSLIRIILLSRSTAIMPWFMLDSTEDCSIFLRLILLKEASSCSAMVLSESTKSPILSSLSMVSFVL